MIEWVDPTKYLPDLLFSYFTEAKSDADWVSSLVHRQQESWYNVISFYINNDLVFFEN